MKYYPTPAQKELILKLNGAAELDRRAITLMHKPVLIEAGLWSERDLGRRLDEFIGELSHGQATRLVGALQNAAHVGGSA